MVGQLELGSNLSTWTTNNGLAVVLLFLILLAMWRTFSWLAKNVIVPTKDAVISHLINTDKTMESMQKTMEGMHSELQKTAASHESLHTKIDRWIGKT
jgi:Na+-transporting methylmalonyl-CoA/oxaloacetate decarboxylase gamma subunit